METRPLPSEHACRVNDPGKYDKFRRQNGAIESGGKKIDVIYGIKDGKSEIQAYRYPKSTWTAGAARSHCKSHDGMFEAAGESNTFKTETRVTSDVRVTVDENGKIGGYLAVFNKWSLPLGFFKERVNPGAFKKSIEESDQRCCFNHKPELILGRRSAGTFSLEEDDKGLSFSCELPDTSYANDLRESIGRGDVTGCSFTFDTIKDNWNDKHDERELVEVRLYEGGPVTFPAYPATEVSLRAMLFSKQLSLVDLIDWIEENRDDISEEDVTQLQMLVAELTPREAVRDEEPNQVVHSLTKNRLRRLELLEKLYKE